MRLAQRAGSCDVLRSDLATHVSALPVLSGSAAAIASLRPRGACAPRELRTITTALLLRSVCAYVTQPPALVPFQWMIPAHCRTRFEQSPCPPDRMSFQIRMLSRHAFATPRDDIPWNIGSRGEGASERSSFAPAPDQIAFGDTLPNGTAFPSDSRIPSTGEKLNDGIVDRISADAHAVPVSSPEANIVTRLGLGTPAVSDVLSLMYAGKWATGAVRWRLARPGDPQKCQGTDREGVSRC
ncbi:hypothetical protein WOLCODRAFT_163979 [Wolfiporia cocos MD-104 SS10]|uniref:Uncharacterized protein n=1 Tax=Wolfiporia cocos (strain MD-104) TaxID=742152 RepID=A0A2H3JKH2_WOLCO|nr:hypothetical protein WOLCODRAFT_163979 [Wolfiporia cocos MD-104 SS10]